MGKSLRDRMDEDDAPGWRPEPGDVLVGTITEISSRDGGWGEYPILVVETDDGETIAVHAFDTVIKNEVSSKRPNVGDSIGVKYLGEQEPKKAGGARYKGYKVKIQRAEGSVAGPDWSGIQKAAEAEAQETGAPSKAARNEGPF